MNEMNLASTVPASIPLPKLPQNAAASPERHEIRINITRKAFDGLARQGMLFQQGVHEGCDNALAAAVPGEQARICIALAPDDDKNYLHMAVRTGGGAWTWTRSKTRCSWAACPPAATG